MSAWRTGGIGPDKAGAGLRGIGFIAIGIAFLAVSNQYVSGDDDPPPTTAGGVVLTVPAIRAPLEQSIVGVKIRTGTSEALRIQVEEAAAGDLFVTDVPADAAKEAAASRCGKPVQIAIGPPPARATYVACVPSTSAVGELMMKRLTGLEARAALLDAGFDVPEQR